MENLNRLWQAARIVADIRDMTRHRETFSFPTTGPTTVYLRAEGANVRVMRWAVARVEVTVQLEGTFGWRMATDHDEAGVYIAARRRSVARRFSTALFELTVPHDAYLMLKLEASQVTLVRVDGTLYVPPDVPETEAHLQLTMPVHEPLLPTPTET
jgi:hypothetical protein